ncbi:hypothetical protein [Alkaliphilus serpentinus]|uniref:Uncharacterized protein n=1 Tax=Alkaliphilus serpentinus TaxID=1482731 RepID=A0A833HMQ4_9FIRM|nr:hypothetical protein [Alkaliphilus serpentinus]KAB3527646.1 hypothetical protein F8153_11735 [Alkaliphilus serpentinus]
MIISIEVSDHELKELEKRARNKEVTLDEYLHIKIFEEDMAREDIKSWVIKELNEIVKKLKTDEILEDREARRKKRLIIYSYSKYTSPLSSRTKEAIIKYQEKGFFHEDLFFLIADKREIVGFIGINKQEEELPFGRYLYIYALKLLKDYHNRENLEYIGGFIEAVAKQEEYYSIDITPQNSDFSMEDLRSMGFSKHTTSCFIELKENPFLKNSQNMEDLFLEKIVIDEENLLKLGKIPIGRNLPFKLMLNAWFTSKDSQVYKANITINGEIIDVLFIKEENKEGAIKLLVLLDPIYAFDDLMVKEVIQQILNKLVSHKKKVLIKLPIPLETLKYFKEQVAEFEVVYWFRKLVT